LTYKAATINAEIAPRCLQEIHSGVLHRRMGILPSRFAGLSTASKPAKPVNALMPCPGGTDGLSVAD
jgi:hypothetical protein